MYGSLHHSAKVGFLGHKNVERITEWLETELIQALQILLVKPFQGRS